MDEINGRAFQSVRIDRICRSLGSIIGPVTEEQVKFCWEIPVGFVSKKIISRQAHTSERTVMDEKVIEMGVFSPQEMDDYFKSLELTLTDSTRNGIGAGLLAMQGKDWSDLKAIEELNLTGESVVDEATGKRVKDLNQMIVSALGSLVCSDPHSVIWC